MEPGDDPGSVSQLVKKGLADFFDSPGSPSGRAVTEGD
jgi:hypothetical protein